MKELSNWGHSGKGFYYGLKMSITTDLRRNLLAVRFDTGISDDRITFKKMNKDILGIFVADAGYISKDLEKDFYKEIELNFRNLKMFYAFITSIPRSVDGYLANYIYSLLSYVLG